MSNNQLLKVILGLVILVILLSTVGFFGTLFIAVAAYLIIDLIRIKTFLKWFVIGLCCAFVGATPLFFICVIVGGILYGKEMCAKIDKEYEDR